MILDIKLCQIALKMKNLVILDLSFQSTQFLEFKKAYETRYLHLPCRHTLALGMANGMAMGGKVVVIYGKEIDDLNILEPNLNVKILQTNSEASWEVFEEKIKEFGPAVLLIPEEF